MEKCFRSANGEDLPDAVAVIEGTPHLQTSNRVFIIVYIYIITESTQLLSPIILTHFALYEEDSSDIKMMSIH